jgi:hypothetical protein
MTGTIRWFYPTRVYASTAHATTGAFHRRSQWPPNDFAKAQRTLCGRIAYEKIYEDDERPVDATRSFCQRCEAAARKLSAR